MALHPLVREKLKQFLGAPSHLQEHQLITPRGHRARDLDILRSLDWADAIRVLDYALERSGNLKNPARYLSDLLDRVKRGKCVPKQNLRLKTDPEPPIDALDSARETGDEDLAARVDLQLFSITCRSSWGAYKDKVVISERTMQVVNKLSPSVALDLLGRFTGALETGDARNGTVAPVENPDDWLYRSARMRLEVGCFGCGGPHLQKDCPVKPEDRGGPDRFLKQIESMLSPRDPSPPPAAQTPRRSSAGGAAATPRGSLSTPRGPHADGSPYASPAGRPAPPPFRSPQQPAPASPAAPRPAAFVPRLPLGSAASPQHPPMPPPPARPPPPAQARPTASSPSGSSEDGSQPAPRRAGNGVPGSLAFAHGPPHAPHVHVPSAAPAAGRPAVPSLSLGRLSNGPPAAAPPVAAPTPLAAAVSSPPRPAGPPVIPKLNLTHAAAAPFVPRSAPAPPTAAPAPAAPAAAPAPAAPAPAPPPAPALPPAPDPAPKPPPAPSDADALRAELERARAELEKVRLERDEAMAELKASLRREAEAASTADRYEHEWGALLSEMRLHSAR